MLTIIMALTYKRRMIISPLKKITHFKIINNYLLHPSSNYISIKLYSQIYSSVYNLQYTHKDRFQSIPFITILTPIQKQKQKLPSPSTSTVLVFKSSRRLCMRTHSIYTKSGGSLSVILQNLRGYCLSLHIVMSIKKNLLNC